MTDNAVDTRAAHAARALQADRRQSTVSLLDATAGSTPASTSSAPNMQRSPAEQTALENLGERRSLTRSSRGSRSTPSAPKRGNEGQSAAGGTGARPRRSCNPLLLCCMDPTNPHPARWRSVSPRGWAPRPKRWIWPRLRLKGDPALLADEAAAISMFGGPR